MERYTIKEGDSWEARYDAELDVYAAVSFGGGSRLYLITKEQFDQLEDGMGSYPAQHIFCEGRKLYMDVCDRCGPPYTIVFDEHYAELCPWAQLSSSGDENRWPREMVDAVAAVLGEKGE